MGNTRKPFHQVVAERLIAQLKVGTAPWQRPWSHGSPGMPINPTTGKRYKGINALHLMAQTHSDARWMTYKQAEAAGAQVRKGETGTPVQYWKFSQEQNKRDDHGTPVLDEQGKPVKETVPLERPRVFFATVFNAEQIDGLPVIKNKPQSWDALERAEGILSASGATIRHGENNRAFYRPTSDSIHLPNKNQFRTAANYYATALHELGHWTGHQSRLNRDLSHPFGSEGYAKEELCAEISSMILGDVLGIGHDPEQHAAYVGSWIKSLEDDPLEIFRASAEAEKIQAYVLAFEQKQVIEKELGMQAVTETRDADLQHRIGAHERDQQAQIRNAVDGSAQQRRERGYINVPFTDKDAAKGLGARWDRQEKSWYVPAGVDPTPFAKWADTEATVPQEGQKTAERRIYLAVPYGDRIEAKAAGARWDKNLKSWYAGPKADMKQLHRWLPENVQGQQGAAMTPKKEFAEALKSLGCVLSGDHPIMDGKKHRIGVAGDKKGEQAGFYVGHLDGHPAGYIKNNRTGVDMKWKAKGYALDPQEKAKLQAEAADKLAIRQAEHARQQKATAQRVQRQTQSLVPVSERTRYMRTKGIHSHSGALTDAEGKKTYLPATDAAGKQWTMQYIQEDGTKRFARDGRKEGCFHALAEFRVNPRPIGRGYKREARSGSILVSPDSAHTLSVFR